MDIESIKDFATALLDSAIQIKLIAENPMSDVCYSTYERLRPRLNRHSNQLDIDTEFYNELDINRKNEILKTLDSFLGEKALQAKAFLIGRDEFKTILETSFSNAIEIGSLERKIIEGRDATMMDHPYFRDLWIFWFDILNASNSIIDKMNKMRDFLNRGYTTQVCSMSDGANMTANITDETPENTKYSKELKRMFRNNVAELTSFLHNCRSLSYREIVLKYKNLSKAHTVISPTEHGLRSSLYNELVNIGIIDKNRCKKDTFVDYFNL